MVAFILSLIVKVIDYLILAVAWYDAAAAVDKLPYLRGDLAGRILIKLHGCLLNVASMSPARQTYETRVIMKLAGSTFRHVHSSQGAGIS